MNVPKIVEAKTMASSFIRIEIGNGDDTFFWWDLWTPFGPLIHFIGCEGPSRLCIPLFHTISELSHRKGGCYRKGGVRKKFNYKLSSPRFM